MATKTGKSCADFADELDRVEMAEFLSKMGSSIGQEAAAAPPVKQETAEEIMERIARAVSSFLHASPPRALMHFTRSEWKFLINLHRKKQHERQTKAKPNAKRSYR